jgi:hypothetical protein
MAVKRPFFFFLNRGTPRNFPSPGPWRRLGPLCSRVREWGAMEQEGPSPKDVLRGGQRRRLRVSNRSKAYTPAPRVLLTWPGTICILPRKPLPSTSPGRGRAEATDAPRSAIKENEGCYGLWGVKGCVWGRRWMATTSEARAPSRCDQRVWPRFPPTPFLL